MKSTARFVKVNGKSKGTFEEALQIYIEHCYAAKEFEASASDKAESVLNALQTVIKTWGNMPRFSKFRAPDKFNIFRGQSNTDRNIVIISRPSKCAEWGRIIFSDLN
jgi:hypothetical protein